MMIPEPWSNHESMSPERKAFYQYHSSLMEPWDGPASIAFTDGTVIGAVLDRNGLRPSRYYVTKDDLVIMASEVGVLDVPPRGRAGQGAPAPGQDLPRRHGQGPHRRRRGDQAGAGGASIRTASGSTRTSIDIDDLPAARAEQPEHETVFKRQQAFGYTQEDLRFLIAPMAMNGEEPVGSMGTDTSLAVLSDKPRLLYDYFKQLFAQVTNPPLDAIREELVTDDGLDDRPRAQPARSPSRSRAGRSRSSTRSSTTSTWRSCATCRRTRRSARRRCRCCSIRRRTAPALEQAMDDLCRRASEAVAAGFDILILSDRGVGPRLAPIPSLLATAGVHHHLVREGTRTRCALVVESRRRARSAPRLAAARLRRRRGEPVRRVRDDRRHDPAGHADRASTATRRSQHYIKALNKGILKVMSKMGISTLQSYCGAQIFEAIGLSQAFIDQYFTHTTSRVGGVGIDVIAEEVRAAARARVRPAAGAAAGARGGRRVPVAARRRVPPVQPGDGVQAAARDAQRAVHDLQGVHARRRRAERAPRDAARPVPAEAGRTAGADRRGRAGRGDRQAVRDRRDVVRLDQPGGARDAGHRDEPPGRQVEHRRGRRGSRALHPAAPTATRSAARSSRWRRAASA